MTFAIDVNLLAGLSADSPAASAPAEGSADSGLPFELLLDAQTAGPWPPPAEATAAAPAGSSGMPRLPFLYNVAASIDTDDAQVDEAMDAADLDEHDLEDGLALLTLVAAAFFPVGLTVPAEAARTAETTGVPIDNPDEAMSNASNAPTSFDRTIFNRLDRSRQTLAETFSASATQFDSTAAENLPAIHGSNPPSAPEAAEPGRPSHEVPQSRTHLRLAVGNKVLVEAALRAVLDTLAAHAAVDAAAATPAAEGTHASNTEAVSQAPPVAVEQARLDVEEPVLRRSSGARPVPDAHPIEALHLTGGAGGDVEPESGSEQQPGLAGRDAGLPQAVRTIHAPVAASTFDTALGFAQAAESSAAVALPNQENVAASVVQSMRLLMRDGVGTAVINLEPDYLGAVTIALRVDNGSVTATLHAQNPQVRTWMEANEPMLRQGLAEQGLTLDRLLVADERVSEEGSHAEGRRHQQDESQPRPRPRRAATTTFEVVV